jgi:hypothetical protein
MAVNINIPKPVIDYNDLDNKPTLVAEHSELILDDGTNPHGTTASDVGAYTTTETDNLLNNKVDKVTGERLITATEITKLFGIQDGAEVNVNADWNATSGDAQILNKPTIPDPSDFVEKSDFTSHSILAKQSGGSDPVAVSIGNNEILGRKSGGGSNIEGLSVSEVKSLLNYTASDVGAPSGSGSSTGTNTGDQDLSGLVPTSRNITINGTTQDLSADRTFTVGNKFAIIGNSPVITASGLTRFISPFQGTNSISENLRSMAIPFNITINKLYIGTANTQPASGSSVLTLRKNGVATSIVVTIPAGSASGVFSDILNSVSFLAGDLISIEHINNATVNSAQIAQITISE